MINLSELEHARLNILWALEALISQAQADSGTYTDQGPSPHDNHLGYTEYDLKKYRKILSAKYRKFLKKNEKEITRLKLKTKVAEMIKEARTFLGKTTYKIDPNAVPGTNHHTGRPYY